MGHRCRKSVLEGHIRHEAFGVSADTSTVTPFVDKLQCKMCGMAGKIRVVEDLDSRYVRETNGKTGSMSHRVL